MLADIPIRIDCILARQEPFLGRRVKMKTPAAEGMGP